MRARSSRSTLWFLTYWASHGFAPVPSATAMSYNHAMFKQATVQDISNQRVTKLHGHVIVITRHYPRFLKRNLLHDYVPLLAPPLSLLKEFKAAEAAMGDHDGAFESIAYESKFSIGESGLAALSELANESQTRSIYLVCHCAIGQRCQPRIDSLTCT